VEAASIDTANTKRDNHLRSQDFFWVERHPTIVFESVRAAREAGGVALVGRLTVRGVTREITVPVRVEVTPDRFVARGEFSLKRTDYEINYQSVLNPVGDVVDVGFVFRGRRAGPDGRAVDRKHAVAWWGSVPTRQPCASRRSFARSTGGSWPR